jgi:hypothetical protein
MRNRWVSMPCLLDIRIAEDLDDRDLHELEYDALVIAGGLERAEYPDPYHQASVIPLDFYIEKTVTITGLPP